jgi:hypothetical protein
MTTFLFVRFFVVPVVPNFDFLLFSRMADEIRFAKTRGAKTSPFETPMGLLQQNDPTR